jgi:hypothetical protein
MMKVSSPGFAYERTLGYVKNRYQKSRKRFSFNPNEKPPPSLMTTSEIALIALCHGPLPVNPTEICILRRNRRTFLNNQGQN